MIVLALPFLFLILTSESGTLNGSPGGKTGSPGDGGNNCTECHLGSTSNEDLWIYSPELLASGYHSGQTYNIVVVGLAPDPGRFGFEATAESEDGAKVGNFTPGLDGFTKLINNNKAVTHTFEGTTPLSAEGTAWFFTWEAPSTTTGDVTFYAAINVANGNSEPTGDQIKLSSFTVSPALGVTKFETKKSFSIYPNPASDKVTISSLEKLNEIEMVNLHGQLVFSAEVNEKSIDIDLSGFQQGIYFVRSRYKTQRLIISK